MCSNMEVVFPDTLKFVTTKDVKDYLRNEYGALLGQPIDSIRLGRIESIIESKSAVLKCEAWTTDDGILHISVRQRTPAVQFQDGTHGFYVDDRGYIFPLHPDFSADVPVVTGPLPFEATDGFRGEAPSERGREWIVNVIRLISYMKEKGAWEKDFNRIEVSGDGDIVLLPVSGQERFILGQPVMIEDKFTRIHKYYSLIKTEKGDIYETVNVKYKGQIICRAKDMSQPLTSEPEK